MSIAAKILGNTFIQFFGRIITALLAIISVKIITLYLGVEGYGMYTTVYEFVGLFAIVGDLGLYTIALREMAENEKDKQKIYSNILSIRAILTAFVMLCVGIGGMFIPAYQDSPISFGIWICTLAVWLNLFFSITSSILQHYLKMHLATIALVIGKIIGVAFTTGAAFFIEDIGLGFYLLVAAGIIAHAIMLAITIIFASRFAQVRLAFDVSYWKYLMKKAWPYGLALILSTIYFKIDVTLLSLMRPQEEVGLYGVPLRMIEVLVVLPLFFMNSVLGTMTKAIKESREKILRVFQLSLQFLLTTGLPILICIFFLSSDLIRLISSEEFLATEQSAGSDSVLLLLGIALVLSFFSTLFSFTLVAFSMQKRVLIVNAFGALFNLVTNFYFIPKYGFMGAAGTSIASEILIFFLALYYVLKTYPFRCSCSMILKTFCAGILMFTVLFFLQPYFGELHSFIRLILIGFIGIIVYAISLLSLKVLPIKTFQDYFLKASQR